MFSVVIEMGYVLVKRDGVTICGAMDAGNKMLRGIEFTDPRFQKCNQTRQAAMKAYQKGGYK